MSFQSDRDCKSDSNGSGQPLSWLGHLILKTFVPPEWREPLTGDLLEECVVCFASRLPVIARYKQLVSRNADATQNCRSTCYTHPTSFTPLG